MSVLLLLSLAAAAPVVEYRLPAIPAPPKPQIILGEYADMNQTPIRVWRFGDPRQPEAILVVGHADGQCCPKVSAALVTAEEHILKANEAGSEAWIGYGIGQLRGTGTEAQKALRDMSAAVTALASVEPCKDQLFLMDGGSWSAFAAEQAALSATAVRALTQARVSGRPLLLTDERPDGAPPLLLPAVRADGAAVRFTVRKDAAAMPSDVRLRTSFDGYGELASWARREIAVWSAVREAKAALATIGGMWSYSTSWAPIDHPSAICAEVTAEAKGGLSEGERVLALLATADKLNLALTRIQTSRDAGTPTDRLHAERAYAIGQAENQAQAAEVRSQLSDNRAMIASCASGASQVRGKFFRYNLSKEGAPEGLAELTGTSEASIDEGLRAARAVLAQAQAAAATVRLSAQRQEELALDAFLRAWPATYSDAAVELQYDTWVKGRRKAVWDTVNPTLRLRQGADVDATAGWLQRSHVMFRVTARTSDYEVTPYFLLSSDYVIVADPIAGLTRYESILADQLLSHDLDAATEAQP